LQVKEEELRTAEVAVVAVLPIAEAHPQAAEEVVHPAMASIALHQAKVQMAAKVPGQKVDDGRFN